VKAALAQAEAERTRLAQILQATKAPNPVTTLLPNLMDKFLKLRDDLVRAIQFKVDKARGILKDLVGGAIALHPTLDGGRRYLTAELSGDYAGLLKLVTGPKIIYDPGHRHHLCKPFAHKRDQSGVVARQLGHVVRTLVVRGRS
jgi:hypothetical protein